VAGRLLASLSQGPRLIVSLPENSVELARAAADGGADALKVHLHVKHEASGTQFGSLAEERSNLEAILSLDLPTGVVPGAGDSLPSRREMDDLAAMGVDFFDLYAHDMPVWLMSFQDMTRTVAIDHTTAWEAVRELANMGFEMIEAAVIPHEGYGRPLSVADLAVYRAIRRATELPIIVPTQRAVHPEDVPALVGDVGVDALMIGAIVTGRDPDSLQAATQRFASALSALRD
jgi:hypothetical protein